LGGKYQKCNIEIPDSDIFGNAIVINKEGIELIFIINHNLNNFNFRLYS